MNHRDRLGLTYPIAQASAGDELNLLINLIQTEKIGVKMLLQNVAEILTDSPDLLVPVVLLITDTKRINDSDALETDYANALIAVKRNQNLKAKGVLETAISHAAKKAGFIALAS